MNRAKRLIVQTDLYDAHQRGSLCVAQADRRRSDAWPSICRSTSIRHRGPSRRASPASARPIQAYCRTVRWVCHVLPMFPHDMQICRSGTMFFQNETASLFIGPRAPDLGGPTRMSVDWHFGHFPDFKSHPLGLRFRSVRPTTLGVDGRGLRGRRLLHCRHRFA